MDFSAVNTVWVLVGAALVFFMQAGFCILESGLTRAKNAGNIIMKNLMDFCIGTPIFWIIGFGIMFGSSSAIFGGIDLFTRGDYSAVTPDGVPFTHSLFSRQCSVQQQQQLCPEQWQKEQILRHTAFTVQLSHLLFTRYPVTGFGAAAGYQN